MSAKQDRVFTRTPQQLEQKLDLGKRFAEVIGLATDAQNSADEAKKAVETLDGDLTAEEVFNRLTNNGELQGLYRGEDGELYINAEYIVALEKLFAKDINMSGTFTYTAKVFLEPEWEEVETIHKHLLETEIIPVYDFPLYDFNNDGKISIIDQSIASRCAMGLRSLADWSGAVKTDVTVTIDLSNPDKVIRIQGTNMWGREIDRYIGVRFTNIRNPEIADFVVESGTDGIWTYRKWSSGKAECWGRNHITANMGQAAANTFYYLSTSFVENDYPFEFVGVPCEVVSYHAPSTHMGWAYSQWENTESRSGRYCAMRWDAAPSEADVYLDYYVIGEWK